MSILRKDLKKNQSFIIISIYESCLQVMMEKSKQEYSLTGKMGHWLEVHPRYDLTEVLSGTGGWSSKKVGRPGYFRRYREGSIGILKSRTDWAGPIWAIRVVPRAIRPFVWRLAFLLFPAEVKQRHIWQGGMFNDPCNDSPLSSCQFSRHSFNY